MATKQAVVLIHGIGEQRPMDNLRSFVHATWSTDSSVHHRFGESTVWSKPDDISGSFELRRLTTGKNKAGVRTDFFEFYWAYHMRDTKWSHIVSWSRVLLFRSPGTIPKPLRAVWWIIVVAGALALLIAGYRYLGSPAAGTLPTPAWLAGIVGFLVSTILGGFVINYIGDAARYLYGGPANVAQRHQIRTRGVELLRKLHESGQYHRIIVVGHSLGTVIGYDILTYLWAQYHTGSHPFSPKSPPAMAALQRVLDLARAKTVDPAQYREAQQNYFDELRANGNEWLVTDFITLGSPLTYGDFLLASNLPDLRNKQADREFPTAPPALEGKKPESRTFVYAANRAKIKYIPHQAALFAATRWTNLYFPIRNIVWGDLIGGPLRPLFGDGIHDIPVRTTVRQEFLAHTLYWTLGTQDTETDAITKLRLALGLAEPPRAPTPTLASKQQSFHDADDDEESDDDP